ncbi:MULTISPECIES: LysR family transcriptional regulator [Rhodococcus]|uniref:LysR family transcriptional regulator n=1 Tax=Rhodococcus TaxID=1827 RepID=UPI00193BF16B|nr:MULTISPECIES: LysR family transcriptional regulator [Rhodococcus]QRI75314.1 LysR family transcriptional regulator [Rhodococcus aetherivorans]QSE58724.1 LysR family transcriptional regulator [Rhodococcus sp. PSBB066]QSE69954.1 LysR family transcriptional regulator [Rhodococcus sp. PSBB049]UGQ39852.1 LysR family transcriptional regulator [Rhodococcus aetherivorans]
MLDVDGLVALRALRDHGTVTEAASALGYTPSAVSQRVKRLERRLGAALTAPAGRRVVLTPAAQRLLDDAEPLLGQLESAFFRVSGSSRIAGAVTVAAFTTAIRAGIPAALASATMGRPDLSVRVVEADPVDAALRVATGRADVAVLHHWRSLPRVLPDTLVAEHVLDDGADVIVRADHPPALGETLSPQQLSSSDWVSTGEGTLCHEWLMSMFAGHGLRPRITCTSSDFDIHLDFVRAGLAAALVPRLGRRPLGPDLVAIPAPGAVRVVSVVRRAGQVDDPTLAHVVSHLRMSLSA